MTADWSKHVAKRRFEDAAADCFVKAMDPRLTATQVDALMWAHRVFRLWATGNPDYIVQLDADDLIAARNILNGVTA